MVVQFSAASDGAGARIDEQDNLRLAGGCELEMDCLRKGVRTREYSLIRLNSAISDQRRACCFKK